MDVAAASYELFKAIMASDELTDQDWEAARLALHGAFQLIADNLIPWVGEPKEVLKFLDYHLGLQGAGEDHKVSIAAALVATSSHQDGRPSPLVAQCIRNFNCASPSFIKGMRSMIHSSTPGQTRSCAILSLALMSDQWFNSPVPVMKPEEMSEFCERLAQFVVNDSRLPVTTWRGFFCILFGMLRSSEWRNHIDTRLWSLLAHWTLVDDEEGSLKWCLQNAVELLEFTRRLPNGEGFKWWYGTLWFHFDKLDPTVRGEVERIAKDMLSGDGLSDLNLYLNLIDQEMERTRRELDGMTGNNRLARSGRKLRARFVTLEGNHRRLARITDGQ